MEMERHSYDNKILLSDKKKIFQIQEEFQLLFPFLKIRFSAATEEQKPLFCSAIFNHRNAQLSYFRKQEGNIEIIVSPEMTVAELHETFQKQYNLSIKVLRRSGKAWLETTRTNSWTLEEQNRQGFVLSNETAN